MAHICLKNIFTGSANTRIIRHGFCGWYVHETQQGLAIKTGVANKSVSNEEERRDYSKSLEDGAVCDRVHKPDMYL